LSGLRCGGLTPCRLCVFDSDFWRLQHPDDAYGHLSNIDIPVVTVVWNFNGLSAPEMANRIVTTASAA